MSVHIPDYTASNVSIKRKACMGAHAYLVQYVDKHRAIVVHTPRHMVTGCKLLNNYETYWLVVSAANLARKNGWKHIHVDVVKTKRYPMFKSSSEYIEQVRVANNSMKNTVAASWLAIGALTEVVNCDHFLNDMYYQAGWKIE